MDAWADGLNFFLYTHPEVEPRVLHRFEPWMALTFSEGSIGGDMERPSLAALEDFYGAQIGALRSASHQERGAGDESAEPTVASTLALRPSRQTRRREGEPTSSRSRPGPTGLPSRRTTPGTATRSS